MKTIARFLSNAGIDPLRPYAAVETLSADDLKHLAQQPLDCHSVLIVHNRCCCNHRHGLTKSDFSAATVLFCLPQKTFLIDEKEVCSYNNITLLCFNREQCCNHTVALSPYTYFNYNDNEALHISETEYDALQRLLCCIAKEQQHDVDNNSEAIMCHLIGAAFNLCLRMYNRQFILRSDINSKAIEALHKLIDSHYVDAHPLSHPTPPPSTEWLAGELGLSVQYLEDLCQHETGLSVEQHVKIERVEMAQKYLADTTLSPTVIARKFGFCSTSCLNSILEKTLGACATTCRRAN